MQNSEPKIISNTLKEQIEQTSREVVRLYQRFPNCLCSLIIFWHAQVIKIVVHLKVNSWNSAADRNSVLSSQLSYHVCRFYIPKQIFSYPWWESLSIKCCNFISNMGVKRWTEMIKNSSLRARHVTCHKLSWIWCKVVPFLPRILCKDQHMNLYQFKFWTSLKINQQKLHWNDKEL